MNPLIITLISVGLSISLGIVSFLMNSWIKAERRNSRLENEKQNLTIQNVQNENANLRIQIGTLNDRLKLYLEKMEFQQKRAEDIRNMEKIETAIEKELDEIKIDHKELVAEHREMIQKMLELPKLIAQELHSIKTKL